MLLLSLVYHTAEKLSQYSEYHVNMACRGAIFIIMELSGQKYVIKQNVIDIFYKHLFLMTGMINL
jgi:hypothetical protein